MTLWRYSWTAVPSSAPSRARTTRARPDSVPKSTPMKQASGLLALTARLWSTCAFLTSPREGSAPRGAGRAGAHDEFRGDRHPGPRCRAAADPVDEQSQRLSSEFSEILPHRGERGKEESRFRDVVEPDHADRGRDVA